MIGHAMSASMDDPILTLDEAADLLRVTPQWLKKSKCPRIRASVGVVRYDRALTLEWFRAFVDTRAA